PPSAGSVEPQLIEDLVAANRILADQGVLDGWGPVSARHPRNANRYLLSRSQGAAEAGLSPVGFHSRRRSGVRDPGTRGDDRHADSRSGAWPRACRCARQSSRSADARPWRRGRRTIAATRRGSQHFPSPQCHTAEPGGRPGRAGYLSRSRGGSKDRGTRGLRPRQGLGSVETQGNGETVDGIASRRWHSNFDPIANFATLTCRLIPSTHGSAATNARFAPIASNTNCTMCARIAGADLHPARYARQPNGGRASRSPSVRHQPNALTCRTASTKLPGPRLGSGA